MRLIQLAELLKAELKADTPEQDISDVSSPKSATEGSIVFAEDADTLMDALGSAAAAVIVSHRLGQDANVLKPLLLAKNPRLAFARAAHLLRPEESQHTIHSTAIIDGAAVLGRRVGVGPYAVIEAEAKIGENTFIDAGAVIGRGVVIGRNCHIYPRVVIYPGTELGDRVVVHAGAVLGSDGFGYVRDDSTGEYTQFPQQGKLIIEEAVEIGANTTIDRGALDETRISRGVKIDNLVHIGHNVHVGRDVVIAAQTGISGSSSIGNNAVVGGQVGIGDHATIGEQVILGSGSGVLTHKKVHGPGVVFWGRPARPLNQYLKELATLARLARKPERPRKPERHRGKD
ncbi:MAG: UDP-3-O-(3-hydroxymyristoyl)glucosamine N-acyltransferase [Silvibacterium sp.]|nr:UDP-3-O-(3-hydroxymyristoyl)glucosamine N-acyltransferase [Silvibacterium sp.]MBV8436516.1 UDP-3-O-(3-hydroxymyristoyl)glucosamine N-acyltransferase [Silvibacterium sp.]